MITAIGRLTAYRHWTRVTIGTRFGNEAPETGYRMRPSLALVFNDEHRRGVE